MSRATSQHDIMEVHHERLHCHRSLQGQREHHDRRPHAAHQESVYARLLWQRLRSLCGPHRGYGREGPKPGRHGPLGSGPQADLQLPQVG